MAKSSIGAVGHIEKFIFFVFKKILKCNTSTVADFGIKRPVRFWIAMAWDFILEPLASKLFIVSYVCMCVL